MPELKGTPYQQHVKRWRDCIACPLHKGRRQVVLSRGVVPAEVVYIGESPGSSEDSLGKSFCGPAGHLLDCMVTAAWGELGLPPARSAFCNLVACIPKGEDGRKTAEPPKEAIDKCSPRLKEFVRLCKPRLVVLVGSLAQKHIHGQVQFADAQVTGKGKSRVTNDRLPWLPEGEFLKWCSIVHPSAILQSPDQGQQEMAIQRCVVRLVEAFRSIRG